MLNDESVHNVLFQDSNETQRKDTSKGNRGHECTESSHISGLGTLLEYDTYIVSIYRIYISIEDSCLNPFNSSINILPFGAIFLV